MKNDTKQAQNKITKPVKAENISVSQNTLRQEYDKYLNTRRLVIDDIKTKIEQILNGHHSSLTVNERIKSFSSYYNKYLGLLRSGEDTKIMDLLAFRIICPFIEDLTAAEELINKNMEVTDIEKKEHNTFKEFGYESIHLLIKIPQDIIDKRGDPGTDIAEIQIRTILQDAWAEVEHELVYKAEFTPFDEPMKRKLAAVNASLTLADIVFQEIRVHQRNYSGEMDKRRKSFFQKIEEATDNQLFAGGEKAAGETEKDILSGININIDNESIDDLLVAALTAHNQNRFTEAIRQYSRILELNPGRTVCSIIHKHRGMAYFACSRYKEAIDDFTCALNYDAKAYKAAYYRGVVYSVTKRYAKAIDDYTLSLSINPYQSFCLFRRGQAYYHSGDESQALADCENSLALEPDNKSAEKFKELLHEKLKM